MMRTIRKKRQRAKVRKRKIQNATIPEDTVLTWVALNPAWGAGDPPFDARFFFDYAVVYDSKGFAVLTAEKILPTPKRKKLLEMLCEAKFSRIT